MRILIEERLKFAHNEAEKISAFPVIQAALSNLTKMVESLGKLERQTDATLGKDALNTVLEDIVDILVQELSSVYDSESIIDRVASRIGTAIATSHNQEIV